MHHPRVLLLKGTIPIVAIFLILTFLYFYYNYIDSQDGSKMCQGACVLWAKAALAAKLSPPLWLFAHSLESLVRIFLVLI